MIRKFKSGHTYYIHCGKFISPILFTSHDSGIFVQGECTYQIMSAHGYEDRYVGTIGVYLTTMDLKWLVNYADLILFEVEL